MHKNTLFFGFRLKEERARLQLSQKQAADLCGIRREMWGKYERDEAEPGAHALERFSTHGADAQYLLKGIRTESDACTFTPAQLLDEIAVHLGLYKYSHELEPILQQFQAERDSYFNSSDKIGDTTKSFDALRAWLNKSPVVVLQWRELEGVVDGLEFALEKKGETMSSEHKARAIIHLFRRAKELPDGQRLGEEAFTSEVDLYGQPKRN